MRFGDTKKDKRGGASLVRRVEVAVRWRIYRRQSHWHSNCFLNDRSFYGCIRQKGLALLTIEKMGRDDQVDVIANKIVDDYLAAKKIIKEYQPPTVSATK